MKWRNPTIDLSSQNSKTWSVQNIRDLAWSIDYSFKPSEIIGDYGNDDKEIYGIYLWRNIWDEMMYTPEKKVESNLMKSNS